MSTKQASININLHLAIARKFQTVTKCEQVRALRILSVDCFYMGIRYLQADELKD